VLLIVLSTLGYTLSSRVAVQRHRDRYIIDYSKARYACDSAVKYALATLRDINTPQLVTRPNEPDFSDLFNLSEVEYEELLAEWAAKNATSRKQSVNIVSVNNVNDINSTNDVNNGNHLSEVNDINGVTDFNEPNSLTIRGPYGPPWPFVTKPVELEIGSATVRIEVEDENAKYPVGWALLGKKEVQREALAGFKTFCEWMDVNEVQVDSLNRQLKEISKIKPFELDFKPIKKRTPTKGRTRSRRRGSGRRTTTRYKTTTISVSEQVARQTADFAKLFHSSLIDTEVLARPTIVSESRKESALKYTGLWASRKVNINTAPRHVLESAFTFGGDADKIAEEIIQRRRIKPFTNIENLRKSLLRYSDSIEKCKKYITTVSSIFTIKVTAVNGAAKASAIIAITKDGKKIERIAVISG
jgi:DNA uptake protein ComE-like DNA-binding protein